MLQPRNGENLRDEAILRAWDERNQRRGADTAACLFALDLPTLASLVGCSVPTLVRSFCDPTAVAAPPAACSSSRATPLFGVDTDGSSDGGDRSDANDDDDDDDDDDATAGAGPAGATPARLRTTTTTTTPPPVSGRQARLPRGHDDAVQWRSDPGAGSRAPVRRQALT